MNKEMKVAQARSNLSAAGEMPATVRLTRKEDARMTDWLRKRGLIATKRPRAPFHNPNQPK